MSDFLMFIAAVVGMLVLYFVISLGVEAYYKAFLRHKKPEERE